MCRGDICALTKLGTAEPATRSWPATPRCCSRAGSCRSRCSGRRDRAHQVDEDALIKTLAKLVAADPTLRLERNVETHQTVLWCMGEAHADVVLSRLRAGGAEVDTEPVRVPMRETIAGPARVTAGTSSSPAATASTRYATSSSSRCRAAPVSIPSKVVGGSVPTQFIPSVEKGIRAQLLRGLSEAKHPAVDLRATLVDGKAHSVDSSDAAFQTAGTGPAGGGNGCGTVLLEPLDEVAVRIPDEHLGAVLGDLSGRRGRVLGTEVAGLGPNHRPPSPLHRAASLCGGPAAMTSGAAAFTRTFARYDVATV